MLSKAQAFSLLLRGSASTFRQLGSRPRSDPEVLGSQLAESLHKDPEGTAAALTAALDSESRRTLLTALFPTADASVRDLDDDYVDTVFKQADFKHGDGLLDRTEFKLGLQADRLINLSSSNPSGPPSYRTLALIAAAAGLPYMGFGFVDNCIMLVAGEEIEVMFGASLGLTTMAAAALGNLVSDVCGVGLAGHIEAQARKLAWVRSVPRLAPAQTRMGRTKAAKFGGAAIGVSIGCLLGMTPLALF
ncbi:hypothetical protein WJX73_004081 [Symbiochloris irregularis]|uniref:Transmembrane protein 65 n=1 Tax=Symbiochloris irregularis TaxID=706552 RepID=A0AAW1NPC6_9CHLO